MLLIAAFVLLGQDPVSARIARVPEGARPEAVVFSRDGSVVAYLSQGGQGVRRFQMIVGESVVDNGGGIWPPRVSDDGKVVAYAVQVNRKWTVVCGGRRSEELAGLYEIELSRDGKRLAYGAKIDEKWHLVVDGVKGDPFDGVVEPRFSADGSVVAYLAGRGKPDRLLPGMVVGEWFVVVNGKPSGPFDEAQNLVLSPDGKRVAFAGRKGSQWHPVVDGKVGAPFDSITTLAFSADGKTFGFGGRKGEKSSIVIGDQAGPEFPRVGELVFSSDGRTHAYLASDQTGRIEGGYAVFGGKKGKPYLLIERLALSPDGSVPAYSGRALAVVGEKEYGPYSSVGDPVFSADGKKVSFGLREGDAFYWKTFPAR